ncbi:hypothetical protein Bca52824_065684 [Brassica carinata]|uniref:Uncharacterized protein n=1 Tax=Brassica carinata TaxID=52824 RepID=A0A8X7QIP8_BRACI|nr:hypothetical protein Bca52824_065684 [Brassica carinata]
MASTAALVGGRMLPGFFWLLFPISVDPSVAVLEGCRSPYFEGGGSDVEDIALIFGGFADFVR